jgi:hypothetical protein
MSKKEDLLKEKKILIKQINFLFQRPDLPEEDLVKAIELLKQVKETLVF